MMARQAEAVADVSKALSDPTRVSILHLLREEAMDSSGLACELGIHQTSVNYHLSFLMRAGLVCCERDGRKNRYSVLIDGFILLEEYLETFIADIAEEEL